MSYAGDITPQQAWDLLRDNPDAVLIDVRTEAEWRFVGVPDTSDVDRPTALIEWVDSTGTPNSQFVDQLKQTLAGRPSDSDAPVIFLCRSGQRSIGAAKAATAAGYEPSYNVLEGFEGPLDADGHRGGAGWRALGLPWRQS
ncbi:rhodanese-like domain-containing protein [Nocardia pseudobrasiliensis]|uniref:Rhodanese-related sulfurtransferase n=1 Tax=Nocardia pseudobrasiliensis TaxID=45979 RepID=A0A370HXS6_9NOCA|nr:rhodanese-like domain-containing protein [Nocardia pseudobrasiliensis]RDI63297.1 rhodanese-related sulfurtransferase [Nocardia pseudobrasiliensis]